MLKTINTLDETWFGALWAALQGSMSGPLQELVIVAGGPGHCLRCTLRRADTLKFWRRPLNWTAMTSIGA